MGGDPPNVGYGSSMVDIGHPESMEPAGNVGYTDIFDNNFEGKGE